MRIPDLNSLSRWADRHPASAAALSHVIVFVVCGATHAAAGHA